MKLSMIEVAYQELTDKQGKVSFMDLWKKVCKELEFNEMQMEDNIAQFYSDLSLDERFINLGGKEWDLKKRHTLKEVIKDTTILEEDDDEVEVEIEDRTILVEDFN